MLFSISVRSVPKCPAQWCANTMTKYNTFFLIVHRFWWLRHSQARKDIWIYVWLWAATARVSIKTPPLASWNNNTELAIHFLLIILTSCLNCNCYVNRRLVSSYKGKFGYVRYYVRAVMERPAQAALQCEKPFEVEEPLDVNTPDLLVRDSPLLIQTMMKLCISFREGNLAGAHHGYNNIPECP